MRSLLRTVDEIDKSYGVILRWLWNLLLYPIIAVSLWASTAYLDKNYLGQSRFEKYALEQKEELKTINSKLDVLLQNGAANSQRFTDEERRISRLEDKTDRLKGE